MRIAVVHSFYSTRQPSGENAVVEDQVQALEEAGHDVLLVARRTDDLETGRHYGARAALRVASGRGGSPERELTEFAPDVVHLHNTFPNMGTAWLGNWGRRTVVTLHNFRTVCAAGTLFRDGHACTECISTPVRPALRHGCYRDSRVATMPLAAATRPSGALRRIGRDSAEVIVLNEVARAVIADVYHREVQVLPNFVADGVPHPAPHAGWLYVGRLTQEKGVIELLSAWPAEERLDVVGAGPLEDEVRRLAAESPTVRYLGLVDRTDLRTGLGQYEGLILPSLWPEGLPTVVLEAIAGGLPVVMSDRVASSAEFVELGAATLLRTPFDQRGVQSTLDKHRTDTGMRQRAQDLHASRYSRSAWLDGIAPIYERVAAG
ncbi:glycosyltransferase [Nocardioides aestuarii]|uniref:Glycosyltransferase family 4 protein n=1 Tax=Nocardioides aestuarii TaxID=252231 RepID=A0ABW4TIR7_9ACTN